MSLLNQVLSTAKKTELTDGIHDDCILLAVSNEVRKNKENSPINRNCYTKFGKLKEGKVVAESEISWFGLEALEKGRYNNFFDQIDQLTNIIVTLTGEQEAFEEKINTIFEEYEIEDIAVLQETLESGKTVKKLMTEIGNAYVTILQGVIGDKTPIRVKLVFDYKGRNIQAPSYGPVIEKMTVSKEETTLVLTPKELENKLKSQAAPVINTPTTLISQI